MKNLQIALFRIFYFLLCLPAMFLLFNRFPYLQVVSIVLLAVTSIVFFFIIKNVTEYHKIIIFLILLIYAYFIFSYFFSAQKVVDFFSYNFLRYDGNFFFCYILFLVYAVPFFNYRYALKNYFLIIFIVFSVLSIYGIFEYFLSLPHLMVARDVYAGAYFQALNLTHNSTGSVYAVASVFGIIFFLKEKVRIYKLLYFFASMLCISGLLLSKSRGSYVAFFITLIIVLWLIFRSVKKFLISLGIILVPAVIFIFVSGTYKRLLQIFDFKSATAVIRFDLWRKAWFLFSQSPILGVGFGRYNDIVNTDRLKGLDSVFNFYIDPLFIFSDAHAHNSYFQFLAETGTVGLLLLLIFWIICLVYLWKAYNRSSDDFTQKVYLSSISSIITLSILAFSENYFSATTVMVCVSMAVSLSIGLYWQETNGFEKAPLFIKKSK